ncbi:MAG: DEAD/DEAH box helicase [Nanoarchaeota archaeon]|nr:DEAD/DEAH box helicase [Nanoarchaeota archaeon]
MKGFTPRLYQETILNTCVRNNTLVVLPTGMGKTAIAMMLASHRLGSYPTSKILFLAPTKPLVSQHMVSFKKHLADTAMSVMTGEISPEKRELLWNESTIIFSTPQGLSNDIVNNRIKLEEVSCLILDEIHRCTGDYDYVWICEQYSQKAKYARILGLTASPGSTMEQIKEICRNAYIDEIEVRTHEDPDVKPYVQETNVDYVNVELSHEFKLIQKFIVDCLKERIKELKQYGYFNYSGKPSRKDLLDIQGSLHKRIAEGEKSVELWRAVSLGAEAIKVQHALDLLETQGISALRQYFDKLMEESVKTKTKATKRIVADSNFKSAFAITQRLFEEGIEHPKIGVLKDLVKDAVDAKKDAKIIVFNNYRDSALKLTNELNMLEGVSAKLFVGQAKKGGTGLKQKDQLKMLDEFRNAEFNCLVSSSVGEEGLDIPAVDMVIFYEPVPSAIRQIQRRGRTGRLEKGAVKILVTKGTIDEAYRWTSFHRERKMYSVLYELKKKMGLDIEHKKQPKLSDFDNALKIFADTREQHSGVAKELVSKGVSVKMQKLMVGDFIVSDRVGVERKTIADFVDSLIDQRILQQAKELKQNFEKPLMIIEGTDDLYSVRKVHPNAIRGMIAAIAVSFGIPIVHTKNPQDTAELLIAIAKREQKSESSDFTLRTEKKPLTLKEQQEYIVQSFPNVGTQLSRDLLLKFGSVKKIVNASHDELREVEKIGLKKAEEIRKVVDEDYLS